jgi:hypothetical protein
VVLSFDSMPQGLSVLWSEFTLSDCVASPCPWLIVTEMELVSRLPCGWAFRTCLGFQMSALGPTEGSRGMTLVG